jgi:glycosyltransferase involved in cell wall biosynthesis
MSSELNPDSLSTARRKIRAAILIPRLDEYDAVGIDCAGIVKILRNAGYEVSVFTKGWKVSPATESNLKIQYYTKIKDFLDQPSDILIYQYAIAWQEGFSLLKSLKCRKILKFHNVTPPEFFAPYHKGIANACKVGLEQLPDYLAVSWQTIIADSEYNKSVLVKAGADPKNIKVVPPFHRVMDLLNFEPSVDFIKKFVSGRSILHSIAEKLILKIPAVGRISVFRKILQSGYMHRNIILMVGRIVPNKGYEDLIKIFNIYRTKYDPDSRLLFVGKKSKGLELYYNNLTAIIKKYKLSEFVDFAGQLPDSELKSAYLSSRVLAVTSLHEGFCVPAIEALAIGLPVIARNDTALTDTVNGGGILVQIPHAESSDTKERTYDQYCSDFADQIHKVVSDELFSMNQIRVGCRYFYEKYSDEIIQKEFLRIINNLEIQHFTETALED